jgi:pimeloyl-ACP methyl ester carboxylesterase
MELSTRYAQSPDGTSIAFQVHGEGSLDLVFVPGFVSHVELIWEEPAIARFLQRLASFSRLVVFDKRGQGLSDRLGRPPTLEESMDDLGAVMEAAGSERAAIFGISEGGPMSALFAASYPDRVSSLVLYGTYARMVKAPTSQRALRRSDLTAGPSWCATNGAERSPSISGRRATRATPSSNAGGAGCYGRGPAPPGRSS